MNSPHPFIPGQELDDGAMSPLDSVMIDLTAQPMNDMEGGVRYEDTADGGIVVDFNAGESKQGEYLPADANDHDANLADFVDSTELGRIAQQIDEWVKMDIDARAPWYERLADGLVLLGVTKKQIKADGPIKEVASINHPMIAEACIQFQARSIAELVPPTGPAKGAVIGKRTPEKEAQAERVADYENYQLMVEDDDFYPETDAMMFTLAGEGSQFKKGYRDPILRRNVSRWINTEDFIVPYGARSLSTAPRYTHRMRIERNDMRIMIDGGHFRDVSLPTPTDDGQDDNQKLSERRDDAQGQDKPVDQDEFAPHTAYECTCYWDLKGFEDTGPDGKPTGIALPYVITVEKDGLQVLSIRRGWKETDANKTKVVRFVHYPMFPGPGFYSYGFFHLIGGLGEAATGLLKLVAIGAAFSSMQGGFKTKEGKNVGSSQLEWGQYKETDATYDEISRAFYTPPFKDPSEGLFKVLGLLEAAGQRFASTSETMVGDASNMGPVGTTVALIEQGSKVYTGIHKRLHYAQGKELKILAELNAEHIPPEGYPYSVEGADREVLASDFDESVDVVPVSDPNIFSSTQRIAIAQTLVQRAGEAPDLYDRKKVEKRFLEAMRVADPDDVLANKAKIKRADPVTETALMIVGRPAKAFQDQAHDAHIAVHMDQFHRMEAEKSPLFERVAPIILAHVAEHVAYGMRQKMSQAMGITLPPMSLDEDDEEQSEDMEGMPRALPAPELPPQIENEIAMRAAQAIAQLPPPQGGQQDKELAQKAQALDKQAKALQQQADQIEQERQRLVDMTDKAEKARMRVAYESKIAALTREKEALVRAGQQQGADHQTQSVIDKAVKRVEQALSKGRA